jgi:hypothetical protein
MSPTEETPDAALAPIDANDPNAWAYQAQPKLPRRQPPPGSPLPRAEAVPIVATAPEFGDDHEIPPAPLVNDVRGIAKGQDWGRPLVGEPDLELIGTDSMLAAAHQRQPNAVIAFRPVGSSDLAKTLGLRTDDFVSPFTSVRGLDVIEVEGQGEAVNAVVVGIAPSLITWGSPSANLTVEVDGVQIFRGKATSVVVANGQFVHGFDTVPRGHPGDGRLEIQVYAVGRRERKKLQPRLQNGSHLPHRNITERSGREIRITVEKPFPLELDGRSGGITQSVMVRVLPGALQLGV